MSVARLLANAVTNADAFREGARVRNPKVLQSLLGPAWRGFVQRVGREGDKTVRPVAGETSFDWSYEFEEDDDFAKLYRAATRSQWDGDTQLDWSIDVDPENTERPLMPREWVPLNELPTFQRLTRRQQNEQVHAYMSWVLSQFLHGEQGALFAAAQVTQAVPWFEGKLFGATQTMDEARHVEVFHRYLTTKLERLYRIDDNLYVVIDALMSDARFDMKFLGMQIMVEGLALGAFGAYRRLTGEPLLKELLKYVITDEARHVRYGVLALRQSCATLSPSELREREDWAFEIALLLRNRFLLHEFYEEFYGHLMTRRQWDEFVLGSKMMQYFRRTMFERIVPNLERIGLLSDRVKPHYEEAGLLAYAGGRAATELTLAELLEGGGQ